MTGLPPGFRIPTLSIAIVTHNEEANIGDCLDSVKWADDIVVVDQFSDDRTVDICRACGARVYQEPWKGFAGQRNSAIDKTTNVWALALDADERVTPELAFEMAEKLIEGTDNVGFGIPYQNYFRGSWIRHGGWYPDYHLRLFRKDKGRFEERELHETPVLDGPVGKMRQPLKHLAYRDVSHFTRKMDSYSTLMARQYYGEGKRAGAWTGFFHAWYTFFSMYVLRGGFLDGVNGLILAYLYGAYTFLKYSKLMELIQSESASS